MYSPKQLLISIIIIDDYKQANTLFINARLEAVHSDLCECTDTEGQVYKIPKYCFSNPVNMMVGIVEEGKK